MEEPILVGKKCGNSFATRLPWKWGGWTEFKP